MQRRQPVIGRFRRLTECGRIVEFSVSGRLLGLRAVPRGGELPRPGSGGAIPKGDAQHFGVSTSQLQAAQQACQPLLPAGASLDQQTEQCMSTGNCPPALVRQILTAERRFAQCMRSHGVPKYPDPTIDSQGRPVFVFSVSKDGFDPHEPQIMSKEDECQRLAPAPMPRQINP